MNDMIVSVVAACITTAIVVLAVAFSQKKLEATIQGAIGGLSGIVTIRGGGSSLSVGGSSGGTGPLTWLPLWRQTAGVLPDGSPDPQAANDCGETCVAMVLAALTGVLMEPGMIRQQLGGVGRSGLTTGNDLVQALAINHVTAVAQDYVPEGAWEACDTAWEHGYPVIALGHWMSPDYLHWMLLDNKVAQWLVFIDPWTGKEKQIDRPTFLAEFAATLILFGVAPRYNVRGVPTPGAGSQD